MTAEVSIEFPAHLPTSAVMANAARELAALPISDREDALQTLFKVVDNVLSAPSDVKKRRLKKSNETFNRKVGRHKCAVDFLGAVGFVESDDPEAGEEGRGALLSMPVAYIVRLTDAHHSLVSAAEQAGLAAPPLPHCPVFNPYASHRQGLDPTRQVKVPSAYSQEAERVAKEIKDREATLKAKVEKAAPVALRPSVLWAAAGRRLEEILRETADVGDEEKGDSSIVGSQLGHVKNALAGAQTFVSADKRRLETLSKKRIHENCILRVNCPDKSVLQVHFRSADRGEYVMSQIAPLLAPHIQAASWYVYQSPPLKKLAAKETLSEAGFSPGANLYLGFDGDKPGPPYFEASLQAQLGSPPEDAERAVNAIPANFTGEAMGWGKGQRLGGSNATSSAKAPAPAPAPVPMVVDNS
jgi:hypothetical protein